MFRFLRHHPFAVEAFFEHSAVVTFAAPVAELRKLIPPCLTPDTFEERYGFLAAAFVKTTALRPAGFPRALGSDFQLIGYRVFVRYRGADGRNRRGLYILKSQTDSRRMCWLGGFFTRYQYSKIDIQTTWHAHRFSITSRAAELNVELDATPSHADQELPDGSPFRDWKQARRFAGPMPFTFSHLPDTNEVLTIEGVRQNWNPAPARITRCQIPYLETLGCAGLVPASAFVISHIPYRWEKGRLEPCTPIR